VLWTVIIAIIVLPSLHIMSITHHFRLPTPTSHDGQPEIQDFQNRKNVKEPEILSDSLTKECACAKSLKWWL
jgi:hypothetical protein